MKFVTGQIWPLVSGPHLNAHLVSNVNDTLSPFLAFLNKWPPDTERVKGWSRRGRVCAWDLAFIFINLSFFNSHVGRSLAQTPTSGTFPAHFAQTQFSFQRKGENVL